MGNRTLSKREIEEMKKKEEEQAAAQVIPLSAQLICGFNFICNECVNF